mmetsp:Transcript_186/g.227  ORF Transcript_186/g.227 Transcript_186/m.227 type:complete len:204 (-) Transcript_186:182-793(-)
MSWDRPSWQQGLNHSRPSNGTGNSGSIAASWRLGGTSSTCDGCAGQRMGAAGHERTHHSHSSGVEASDWRHSWCPSDHGHPAVWAGLCGQAGQRSNRGCCLDTATNEMPADVVVIAHCTAKPQQEGERAGSSCAGCVRPATAAEASHSVCCSGATAFAASSGLNRSQSAVRPVVHRVLHAVADRCATCLTHLFHTLRLPLKEL